MEEKGQISISLKTLIIILLMVIVVVLAFFTYYLFNKNEELKSQTKVQTEEKVYSTLDNTKKVEDKIVIDNEEKSDEQEASDNEEKSDEQETFDNKENDTQNVSKSEQNEDNLTYEDLMDLVYPKNSFEIDGDSYSKAMNESINMITTDIDEKIIQYNETEINIPPDNKLYINITNTEFQENNISEEITGISDEVVSVKIVPESAYCTPKLVVFLTRNGNIYYVDDIMINNKNFVAKKLNNVNQVVSIETFDVLYDGAMGGSIGVVANTYKGEKINISSMIFD